MEAREMEEMLVEISRLLHRHLAKLGANQEDGKDIVQDAIYKWLLYADAVPPERAPAWMFRVAVNAYYDLCRRRKRHVAVALDEALLVDNETPETAVLHAEAAARARAALKALPQTTRDLLLLKYEERLSYAQISLLLDLPLSHVSTYLHRARASYRKAYKEDS
jgi:RNA polymerase sigma-70 factor (ECF subfamily)